MKITRIEIQNGSAYGLATATISREDEFIEIQVVNHHGTTRHICDGSDEASVRHSAEWLQSRMDGCVGTRGDIEEYRDLLARFEQ